MDPIRAGRVAVALASAAVLLTACATQEADGPVIEAPRTADAAVHPHWSGCRAVGFARDRTDGPPAAGNVPATFRPTTVVWCATSEQLLRHVGTAPNRALERHSRDVRAVLGYLALPSLTFGPGAQAVCPAAGIAPTWLFLLDADGRWVVPKLPTDPCGAPRSRAGGRAAPWTTLSYTDRVLCTFRPSGDGLRCR
ncbi:hypothetical protein FHX74_000040 [Friedmanniella endophytica]|uniref:Lipoprotein n=1 Tax=Microlunatus kandeliicorticis TaxID=1759536 RepID=A0A7W3INQ9_9ACTN|nr:hypothetical protein [Microlunatus kandeliicorticis]MBA8792446.1 hypothetical protein [Microlunatus kandeliicorticis]